MKKYLYSLSAISTLLLENPVAARVGPEIYEQESNSGSAILVLIVYYVSVPSVLLIAIINFFLFFNYHKETFLWGKYFKNTFLSVANFIIIIIQVVFFMSIPYAVFYVFLVHTGIIPELYFNYFFIILLFVACLPAIYYSVKKGMPS